MRKARNCMSNGLNHRTEFWRCLLGMPILISGAPVAAQENLRATLQSRYSDMKSAMAAHDQPAISAMLAPDFISIDVSGESKTASQTISEIDHLKPDPNKSSTTTILNVSPKEDAVAVEQKYDMKTLRIGADGVAHHVELIALSTDTWLRSGNAWLLQKTITREMSLIKDGQLVVHRVKS